jgi:asparagine synthetase B (glutamine-hydrolysing)
MVPAFRLIGPSDPCFVWDGTTLAQSLRSLPATVEGAFAGLHTDDGTTRLVRDPLGLGKLFWAEAEPGGEIELAARPARLTERGHPLDRCYALPANTLTVYSDGAAATTHPLAPPPDGGAHRGETGQPERASEPVEAVAARLRAGVERYVAAILAARPGPAVVCLSGGLDSTSVAALVRAHRPDAVAVTFDLARPDQRQRSEDFLAAETAARHLGMTIVPARHTPEHLLELLDIVLVAGADWRDFNVHAGLVNAALAVSIAREVGEQRDSTTVFTGDLVNEFLADYHEETYAGRTYYRLPRLPIAGVRDALVRGLGTTHRELGIFGDLGLTAVQPYAAGRQELLALPDEILGAGSGKSRLYRAMFGDELPRSCYDRPKTRAQTGSAEATADRGVLAVCVDAGIDEEALARRFAHLHGVPDVGALGKFLRAGRYRTAVPPTRGDR